MRGRFKRRPYRATRTPVARPARPATPAPTLPAAPALPDLDPALLARLRCEQLADGTVVVELVTMPAMRLVIDACPDAVDTTRVPREWMPLAEAPHGGRVVGHATLPFPVQRSLRFGVAEMLGDLEEDLCGIEAYLRGLPEDRAIDDEGAEAATR